MDTYDIPPGLTLTRADLDLACLGLADRIRALDAAKILIAGGTGLFGIWLCETIAWAAQTLGVRPQIDLLTRSRAATAARLPQIAQNPLFTLIESDIRAFQPRSAAYDIIVHAAADTVKPPGCSGIETASVILDGTRNLLGIAERSRARRMLYVSSCSVYGRSLPANIGAVDEEYLGAPLVTDLDIDYDESKRMAEALCVLYNRERAVDVAIARCFPVIGPYLPLDQHFAAGNFIGSALKGEPITLSGDGLTVRSYLYMAELIRWLLTILLSGQPAYPYNVGGSEAVTTADLAQLVAQCVDPPLPVRILGKTAPGQVNSRLVADTSRAAQLGLTSELSLRESIRRTIAWHKRKA